MLAVVGQVIGGVAVSGADLVDLADDTLHAVLAVQVVGLAVTLVNRLDQGQGLGDGHHLHLTLRGELEHIDHLGLAIADQTHLRQVGGLGGVRGERDLGSAGGAGHRIDGQPGRHGSRVDLPCGRGRHVHGFYAAAGANGYVRPRKLNLGKRAELLLLATDCQAEDKRCNKISEFHIRMESIS